MIANIQSITESNYDQDMDTAADAFEADTPQMGPTKETQVRELCVSMLHHLPEHYNPFRIAERLKSMGSLKPIVIFLRQEIQRMSRVIEITHAVLRNLIDAIDGKIVMNKRLHEAMEAIYSAKVPSLWLRVLCDLFF